MQFEKVNIKDFFAKEDYLPNTISKMSVGDVFYVTETEYTEKEIQEKAKKLKQIIRTKIMDDNSIAIVCVDVVKKDEKRIFQIIKRYKEISKSELTKKTQTIPKEKRNGCLEKLEKKYKIYSFQRQGNGNRMITFYKWVAD